MSTLSLSPRHEAHIRAIAHSRALAKYAHPTEEQIEAEARGLAEELRHESAGQRKGAPIALTNGDMPDDPRDALQPFNSEWRDSNGRPVAIAKPGESIRAAYCAAHGWNRGQSKMRVGNLLRGMITGRWEDHEMRALGESINTAGGVMVNPELSAQIIDLMRAKSVVVAAGAQTLSMESDELRIVRAASDPVGYWTGENSTITESDPTFDAISFTAKKLAALFRISRELVEDAPNAASFLEQQLALALAVQLDKAALRGGEAGLDCPIVGILSNSEVQEIGSVGAPTYDDFLNAFQEIEEVNATVNAILMTPDTKNSLARLKESTTDAYLAPPADYVAVPKFITTQLADSTAIVGDMTQVLIAVRTGGVQIDISPYAGTAFEKDQIMIRARWRGDVNIARGNALLKLTGIS